LAFYLSVPSFSACNVLVSIGGEGLQSRNALWEIDLRESLFKHADFETHYLWQGWGLKRKAN
jgi:hypothetical protein